MPASLGKSALILLLLSFCSLSLAAEIKTDKEKLSYAFGHQVGNKLKQSFSVDNIELDSAAFSTAIKDILDGNKARISISEMQGAIKKFSASMQLKRNQLAAANHKAGQEFLKKNKSQEGTVELPSGLQYKIIKNGAGKKPAKNSTVQVHYKGSLLNGEVFDSSYKRGKPTSLQLSNVIKGWQEAIQLMSVGSKWELYIPSDLAYGKNGAGKAIGPNETLVFMVELLKVND